MNRSLVRSFLLRFEPFIVFFASFAFVLLLTFRGLRLPYYWDSAGFISEVNQITTSGFRALCCSVNDGYPHPPLLKIFYGFVWLVTGENLVSFHVVSAIFSGVLLLFVYELGKFLTDRVFASATSLFLLFTPLFLAQSVLVYTLIPSLVFFYGSLLFLFKRRLALFSLFATFAVLSRVEMAIVILVGSLFIAFIERPFVWKRLFFLFPPLSLLLLWLAYHFLKAGWWFFSPDLTRLEPSTSIILSSVRYLFLEQGRIALSVLSACGISYGAIRSYARKTLPAIPQTTAWMLPFFLLFVVYHLIILANVEFFLPRYILPLLPVYYLLATYSFSLFLRSLYPLILSVAVLLLFFLNRFTGFSGNMEDSLRIIDYVTLRLETARYLEENYSSIPIYGGFPESFELRYPFLHFVTQPLLFHDAPNLLDASPVRNSLLYYSPHTSSNEFSQLVGQSGAILLNTFREGSMRIELYYIP